MSFRDNLSFGQLKFRDNAITFSLGCHAAISELTQDQIPEQTPMLILWQDYTAYRLDSANYNGQTPVKDLLLDSYSARVILSAYFGKREKAELERLVTQISQIRNSSLGDEERQKSVRRLTATLLGLANKSLEFSYYPPADVPFGVREVARRLVG